MLTGSCLCGAIAYEGDTPLGPIVHCHCQTCRKTDGAAFSSLMPVSRERFYWTRGEDLLSSFESAPGKFRRFCSTCGSHIFAERIGQLTVMLRLGCLDTPIIDRPKLHMWRSDGATWFDPKDQLPEFPEAPS
jgi:hypothetical protein